MMSRVTFNRERVKLKKLLGIRARLALLVLILVVGGSPVIAPMFGMKN